MRKKCREDISYFMLYEQGKGAAQKAVSDKQKGKKHSSVNPATPLRTKRYLGDHVHSALKAVGITEERVSRWVGRPCGCARRRERLNQLHRWAEQRIKGLFKTSEEARKNLENLLEPPQ